MSKLQRIEAGENSISTTDLQALLGQLKVTDPDLISSLVAQARVARSRSRWDEARYRDNLTPATKMLLDFEAAATEIRTFQVMVIPGILQIREVAEEMLRSGTGELTDLQRQVRVEVRLQRREFVLDRVDRPAYKVVLDQSILYRDIAGPRVYAAQLQHLLDESTSGRIELRVAPFSVTAAIAFNISFTVVTMDNHDVEGSVLYRENLHLDEIVQSPDRVQRHLNIFDQLWQECFSRKATEDLIGARIAELLSPDPTATSRSDL